MGTEAEAKESKSAPFFMVYIRLLAGSLVIASGIAWLVGSTQSTWWGVLLLLSGAVVVVGAAFALLRRNGR